MQKYMRLAKATSAAMIADYARGYRWPCAELDINSI